MTHFPAARHYPDTTFINADLVLVCHGELTSFSQELESRGFLVLGVHQTDDGLWKACFALDHDSGEANFQMLLKRLLSCLEALPQGWMNRWNTLTCRRLDLGFEAGTETRHYSRRISTGLLRRMVALDIELVITIYAPVAEPLSLAVI